MKKGFFILIAGLMMVFGLGLGGCVFDSSNTLNIAPDGTKTYELTNDGMYYLQYAEYEKNQKVDCKELEGDKCTIAILSNALARRPFAPRGMNGVEGTVSLGKDLIHQIPAGFLGATAIELAKRPSNVQVGNGGQYINNDNDIVGAKFNDGNSVSNPFELGTDKSMTTIPEVAGQVAQP